LTMAGMGPSESVLTPIRAPALSRPEIYVEEIYGEDAETCVRLEAGGLTGVGPDGCQDMSGLTGVRTCQA
jgi:hypothetical protein